MDSTSAENECRKRHLDQEYLACKHRKVNSLFMFGDDIEVVVIQDVNGEIWFKGVDVARALEMANPSASIFLHIGKENTTFYESLNINLNKCQIPGLHPKTIFINEEGMNMFVLRSNKPKAVPFSKWVCRYVLPSIRRTGKYEIKDPNLNPYKQLNEYLKQQVDDLKLQLKESNKRCNESNKRFDSSNAALMKMTDKVFSMRPSCIAPLDDERKDEFLVLYRKFQNKEEENDYTYPYYACRVQKERIAERKSQLMEIYPKLIRLRRYKVPNAVNFFNYICSEMSDIIERGKGKSMQSFCLKASGLTQESSMLRNVDNLYRYHYE